MKRYDEIISIFREFVEQADYFNSFAHGSIEKIDAVVNKSFPTIFVRPMSSPGLTGVDGRERRLVFEVYSLDLPRLSDEDNRLILSNTEQGIYEFYAYILDGLYQYPLQIEMTSLVPVMEAFQDRAIGWVMTITIITDAVGITYCEIA